MSGSNLDVGMELRRELAQCRTELAFVETMIWAMQPDLQVRTRHPYSRVAMLIAALRAQVPSKEIEFAVSVGEAALRAVGCDSGSGPESLFDDTLYLENLRKSLQEAGILGGSSSDDRADEQTASNG